MRDEMKVQLREILIVAAVDDQPIGRKMKFLYKALNGGIQIAEKFSIPGIKLLERSDSFLRDKQYVKCVRGLWVMERQECVRFAQPPDRDGKAHMLKHPADEPPDPRIPYPLPHTILQR